LVQGEQRHRVSLFGGGVARMQTDGTRRRFWEGSRVVAAHQRVNRRFIVAVPRCGGCPSFRKHRYPFAPQQPPDELRIRLVDLAGELARRVAIAVKPGKVEFESSGQCRATLTPFVEQRPEDIDDTELAEHAGVGALVHQRQRVADGQLVHAQFAVALADLDVPNDCVDEVQLATVGNESHRDRHAEK
jgi:hypothetical protein